MRYVRVIESFELGLGHRSFFFKLHSWIICIDRWMQDRIVPSKFMGIEALFDDQVMI